MLVELFVATGEAGLSRLRIIFKAARSQQIAPNDWRNYPFMEMKNQYKGLKSVSINLSTKPCKLYAKNLRKKIKTKARTTTQRLSSVLQ